MDQPTLTFLSTQRISVLSILQTDTTVHSATLHFAYASSTNTFYFLTDKESRKCRPLLSGEEVEASLVIGFDEHHCETFQAEGKIKILQQSEADREHGWEAYGGKYPDRLGAKESPQVALLQFTPTWHRFSSMQTAKRFTKEENS